MRYRNVVWDWNGTLLDDVKVGHGALKQMLEKRGMRAITLDEYRERFGFPVRDFYEALGFDFCRDGWHEVSADFVETYDTLAGGMTLNRGVDEVLKQLQETGVRNYVLSALQETSLCRLLKEFGINGRFTGVCGADDIYAGGKIPRGERMLADYGFRPEETLMVGDTLHDAEVAEALGFDWVLFAGGHNSEERLRTKGRVITEIPQLMSL